MKYLFALFKYINSVPSSKMNEYNIAVCLAITMLVPKKEMINIATDTQNLIKSLTLMQKYSSTIFPVCLIKIHSLLYWTNINEIGYR